MVRGTVQVSPHLSATKMTLATHLADLILKGMTDNFSYIGCCLFSVTANNNKMNIDQTDYVSANYTAEFLLFFH